MDYRTALKSGTELVFKNSAGGIAKYIISREIGRGGSCIVYDAFYFTNAGDKKSVRIKEFYPYKLRLMRDIDGKISTENCDISEYNLGKEKFAEDFLNNNRLLYLDGLIGAVINTIDIYDGNNTKYIVSAYSSENTLANYKPKTIMECVSIIMQTAEIIGKIHDAGYLYLDLKPQNILVSNGVTLQIQLFDFDSLIEIERVATPDNAKISYSKGFAAIELQKGEMRKLGRHTDVYGIGAVLFFLLFGRTPTAIDCMENAEYDMSKLKYNIANYSDRLGVKLTEFFRKSLANFCFDRYKNTAEMLANLREIYALSDDNKPFVYSSNIPVPEALFGREKEISVVTDFLSGDDRILFVSGMGGIGKTSVINYAVNTHKSKLLFAVILNYSVNLCDTIIDDFHLKLNKTRRFEKETNEEYYHRKLTAITEISRNENAVIVIDNFTENNYPKFGEDFKALIETGVKIILISRKKPIISECKKLHIEKISANSELKNLFELNSEIKITDDNNKYFDTIISKTAAHTLTVILLARQIKSGIISLSKAAEIAESFGFSDISGEVFYSKDFKYYHETIGKIITEILNISTLSEREIAVMKTLCLISGEIKISLFSEILNLTDLSPIYTLNSGGWCEISGENLSLHPVIREIIFKFPWDKNSLLTAYYFIGYFTVKINENGKINRFQNPELATISEGICESVFRDNLMQYSPAALNLYCYSVLNAPRYKEEFIIKYSFEALQFGNKINLIILMNVGKSLIDTLTETGEEKSAEACINSLKGYALKAKSNYVTALYYDIVSEYLDYKLSGAYYPENAKEKRTFSALLKAIDKTIKYAKNSEFTDGIRLYANNLLFRATLLIRSYFENTEEIKQLISTAKSIIFSVPDFDLYSKAVYYSVCAWYYTLVKKSPKLAQKYLAKYEPMMQKVCPTDLDIIDNIYTPCAEINLLCENYEKAIEILNRGIKICREKEEILPYARKEYQLYNFCLDVAVNMENGDLCKMYVKEIDRVALICGIEEPLPMWLREGIKRMYG